MTGPYVDSFADVYAVYDAHDARSVAHTADEVATQIRQGWSDGGRMIENARAALDALPGGALPLTLSHLNRLLDQGPKG